MNVATLFRLYSNSIKRKPRTNECKRLKIRTACHEVLPLT